MSINWATPDATAQRLENTKGCKAPFQPSTATPFLAIFSAPLRNTHRCQRTSRSRGESVPVPLLRV
eukprot:scaffold990_cov279-Pinguiococcus_pyrenoidosus.AAC.4